MSRLSRHLTAIILPAVSTIALGTALAPSTASAQQSSFVECRDIENDGDRLSCYDRLADSLRRIPAETRAEAIEQSAPAMASSETSGTSGSAAVSPDQPAPVVADNEPVDDETVTRLAREDTLARQIEQEEQAFGADRVAELRKEEAENRVIDELDQPITAYRILPYGELRVVLENGQVWEQIGADGTDLTRADDEDIQQATIRRGFLGSFKMRVEPIGKTIKVTRIR